jgi:hypothetical protein
MNKQQRTIRHTRALRAAVAAGALAAILGGTAGCSTTNTAGTDTPAAPVTAELAAGLDIDRFGETATTAMETALSWRPASDRNEADALDRSRAWVDDTLVDGLVAAGDGRPPADPRWADWAQRGAVVFASCSTIDAAVESPHSVAVDVACTQYASTATGEGIAGADRPARLVVTADGPRVRVTALSERTVAPR